MTRGMKVLGSIGALGVSMAMTDCTHRADPQSSSQLFVQNPYDDSTAWLCRPGRLDACSADLSTTVVERDGTVSIETAVANRAAPIDCFYVYPTVSREPTTSSGRAATPEVVDAARQQIARFRTRCRVFAPLYRQITLAGVAGIVASSVNESNAKRARDAAYEDVRRAWRAYRANDNGGRGFVLIGHSQGAAVLVRLINEEIDNAPQHTQMVSAILVGQNIVVPSGKDVGGTFQHVRLCRSSMQIGCVITYASFPSTDAPSSDAMFGRTSDTTMVVACTNPAALSGGSAELNSYFTADRRTVVEPGDGAEWTTSPRAITTSWVREPHLISAQCTSNVYATGYLEIVVHNASGDVRSGVVRGTLRVAGRELENWGWHVIDLNLAQGDLLNVIRDETTVYLAQVER